ncbi:MAG: class I SAM-dependent methyltransferase [Leptospiraceae bacterium]|nr:class I SAM-dependent methyltransferase [Leptospiraceae bacterium]MCB1314887.1 class I SAM-dependent methyltransferase [Leptospiraceae bacterium]
MKTRFYHERIQRFEIIPTEELSADSVPEGWAAMLEHERVPFVSYPYEWSSGMLRKAALLQLELMLDALNEGMIIKDATPFNIQWSGVRSVFIDVPSFEVLRPGEPWVAYRQFCRMFLYPLMLRAYRGLPSQPWLRAFVDGIEPEFMNRMLATRDYFRAGVFSHVFMHALISRQYAGTGVDQRKQLRDAGFHVDLIRTNVRRLIKIVSRLKWKDKRSAWSDYAREHSYPEAEVARKEQFVSDAVRSIRPQLVWDLGCNAGHFARIAAKHSGYVVACDADHLVIERLFESLCANGPDNILPLAVNLTDPSPALGWNLRERKTMLERGRPDMVLALALVHHIVISGNIPLGEFLDWLSEIGCALVIEFPTRADEMVRSLLRNKADQYSDYSLENFESLLTQRFTIRNRLELKDGRRHIFFVTVND